MTHSQESRVSSSQDTFRLTEESISSVSALVNRLNSCLAVGTDVFDESNKLEKMAATSNQDEKKLEATFPWLATFWDLCQAALGSRSIKRLENLLSFYLGNVTANVKDCYMKPNRAAKLRKCMNDSLAYFHLFYQDIREPMEHSSYLDKMTDLVSMYMDMEIKASRRRKESLKKITCRLSSSLYIFLDNSEDHILDAILKAKLVNKNYRDICIPLLGKILNNMRTYPLYEMLYVRYLLVFKIWKKVVSDAEERRHINKVATQKLNPPPNFMEKSKIFNNVLPKIPKSKKNITLFFMQAKFNLKNACTAFLKGCKDSQQSGFSHTLSANMDKPNFFTDRLDHVPDKENVTSSGGSNLIEDIWSSLANPEAGLTESSQLQELSRNKSKPDNLTGKRKKEKCKKKQKKKEKLGKTINKLLEKGKKKKKKLLVGNDTVSVLSGTAFGVASLLKKSTKGDKIKKKKKKKLIDSNSEITPLVPQVAGTEESICMVESNVVADSVSPVLPDTIPQPITSPDSVQTPQILTQVTGLAVVQESVPQKTASQLETSLDGTSEVKTEVEIQQRKEVIEDMEAEVQTSSTNNLLSLGHSQVMVNQVNSAGESIVDSLKEIASEEGEKYSEKGKSIEPDLLNQVNKVNSAGCLDESQEQIRVTVIATGAREPVVPSSSCSISEGLATSHNSTLLSQENEAIASEANRKSDETSTDAVLPRTVRDPILVPSQTTGDPEAVTYACDSSIKNEIPITEEECAPVGRDNFNSVPMEIDSDVEILAELRPQVTVKCGGVAEEEIVLSDDGEIMRQESQLDNIFATENADLVIEMLGGVLPGGLQVPNIELNNSPHSEEGGESESPEIETFDVYETLSLNDIMNNFLRSKGDYSQYGSERRDCLYRDSMLHPGSQSSYDRLVALQGSNAHQFMEEDDCDDPTSEDELESCYELSHSHSNYAHNKRPCIKGGKVGFNGAVSSSGYASVSVNDKEVSGDLPSSCVENDSALDSTVPSKNAYISGRNNVFNATSDSIVSGRDTPSHPHIGLETPALSTARSPPTSIPKRLSDVNTMRYYTSTLDQPVQSENVEGRTENVSLESENKRPPSPKKNQSSSTIQPTQVVTHRKLDSPVLNRRVSVQLTQISPDSASGVFPDVVLDAHKVSGQREKETIKTPSRGRGRGRGRGAATRRCTVNTRITRQGGSVSNVSKKKPSPEPVTIRETRSPAVSKERGRKATRMPRKRKGLHVNARPHTRSISNLMKSDDHKT